VVTTRRREQIEGLPLTGWRAERRRDLVALLEDLNRRIGPLDEAVRAAAEANGEARLLMTHPAWVRWYRWLRAGDRRLAAVCAGQAGGQLSGPDSSGRIEREQAATGPGQQAGQLLGALAAGGGRCDRPTIRCELHRSMCGCR